MPSGKVDMIKKTLKKLWLPILVLAGILTFGCGYPHYYGGYPYGGYGYAYPYYGGGYYGGYVGGHGWGGHARYHGGYHGGHGERR